MDTLLDNSVAYPGPTIDSAWFPNTRDGNSAQSGSYWTSSPNASVSGYAWVVRFDYGYGLNNGLDSTAKYVRLVRRGH